LRNPLRPKRDRPTTDPRHPHPFQDARDAGLAAFSSGGAGSRTSLGDNVQQVAMTSAYRRTEDCGVPGCGKPRGDDIHAPED
jgi:hypothetical protein